MRPLAIQMEVSQAAAGLYHPEYDTPGAPSINVVACHDAVLRPFEPIRISTGMHFGLPHGIGAQILPFSPLAEHGVTPAAELLGADDRSVVTVLLTWVVPVPVGDSPMRCRYTIERGDVIARVTFLPLVRVKLAQVRRLASGPGARIQSAAFAEEELIG